MLIFSHYKSLLSWYLYHDICFDFIFFFNIVEVVEYKTTLISCTDFLNVIFKSLQGCKLTLKDLVLTSCDTNLAVTLECTIQYIASAMVPTPDALNS